MSELNGTVDLQFAHVPSCERNAVMFREDRKGNIESIPNDHPVG